MNTIGSPTERTRSPLGELPPPAPKAFFGRDTLVGRVVALARNFEPIALIGAGGIGKTSIALTVLHHDRIKDKFGDNRRFIRCDKFTPSLANFLARLSKVIGAGVENPEDLTPLRPFLSSNKILIVFDNVESILDPEGTDSAEILAAMDELCQFDKVCVCITSRLTTAPQYCRHPEIPTLSIEAACDIFYGIYDDHERSDIIDDLLRRLEFHPLSITLLATTATDNNWSYNRLVKEWNTRREKVLQTATNKSLAASLQLSLDSPTFLKLGPSARDLLGVIAFFPQGINENHLDWLFPTFPDIEHTLDKFCVLSLTHRTNDYITMLAPIRDHLSPRNPGSSPLLCAVKDCYFSRLSTRTYPGEPGFEESRWITSEDVNVEHLLNIFTSIDANADGVWGACGDFMFHLCGHKPRKTVLGPKVEGLSDNHSSKPECLFQSSQLLERVGNHAERKRILTRTLKLHRERGDRPGIGRTLWRLSDANRWLGLHEEGIRQARESSEIFEELGDTKSQAVSLIALCVVLRRDNQLDAAEDAAFRAISLNPEKFRLCDAHRFLGQIYESKGEKAKAIHHLEISITIASSIKSDYELFWNHFFLAHLFLVQREFDEANSHVEQAKSYAVNNAYNIGRATEAQARIWDGQHRLEEAKVEISRALEILENLGATKDAGRCSRFLRELNGR